MPSTYPAAPPSLSGDLLSISRFLQSPTAIQRRLRTYVDLRFVSDQVLQGRYNSNGGAVLYETAEPFLTDRPVQAVPPGSDYPQANVPTGTAGLAAVQKWGQRVPLTDEEIKRNTYGAQIVDRTLKKVVNSVIAQVDAVAMSAVASMVTQSVAATSPWTGTGATPVILRDILLARKQIIGLNLGYNPDTLLLDDSAYAFLLSDLTIANLMRRESTDNPVYTGEMLVLSGLSILVSPHTSPNPLVFDSSELGGMADETGTSPGYAISDLAVEVKSLRKDGSDKWELQGRRLTVPVVREPGSACYITATGLA